MMRVVQFNWPMYLLAATVFFVLLSLSTLWTGNAILEMLLLSGAVVAIIQAVASLVASHWVYDLSALNDWRFIEDFPAESDKRTASPRRIIVVHAGYDETHGTLLELFPGSEVLYVDFFQDLGHREPSIVRARRLYKPTQRAICFSIRNWPVEEFSADLILIAFAAHELREQARREELFWQARTTLAAGGRIILVEHVRNLPNFIAFGIGAFHFFPSTIWRQTIAAANLRISNSFNITPFVEVLVLCR